MKKQYIIAALLLLGFGVISTMAFTIETPTAQKLPKVYDFDTSQTSATITKVRVTPFLNKDAIRIKVDLATLTDDNYYILGVELYDGGTLLALSGATVSVSGTATSPAEYESDLGEGYVGVKFQADGVSDTLTIKIALPDVYLGTDDLLISVMDTTA